MLPVFLLQKRNRLYRRKQRRGLKACLPSIPRAVQTCRKCTRYRYYRHVPSSVHFPRVTCQNKCNHNFPRYDRCYRYREGHHYCMKKAGSTKSVLSFRLSSSADSCMLSYFMILSTMQWKPFIVAIRECKGNIQPLTP